MPSSLDPRKIINSEPTTTTLKIQRKASQKQKQMAKQFEKTLFNNDERTGEFKFVGGSGLGLRFFVVVVDPESTADETAQSVAGRCPTAHGASFFRPVMERYRDTELTIMGEG